MSKSNDKKSNNFHIPDEENSYIHMNNLGSPLLLNENIRSINLKNSEQNIQMPGSNHTSFNFVPSLNRSPQNLYNVPSGDNEKEIQKMQNAAKNLNKEFRRVNQVHSSKKKFNDELEINFGPKRKKKISKLLQEKEVIKPIESDDGDQKIFNEDYNLILENDKAKEKVERAPPKRTRRSRKKGCNCQATNCLKLHCICFKNLGYCSDGCRCRQCLNTKKFETTRNFAIEKTKLIFTGAFTVIEPTKVKDIEGNEVNIYIKGCNCKKGCWRNYCDCKKAGGVCSYICKCVECENSKVELPKEEVQRVFKPCSRKKHKLVIKYDEEKALKDEKNIIEFMKYKNTEYIPEKMDK